jgi:hypothetical protein
MSNAQRDVDLMKKVKSLMTKNPVQEVCYEILCDDGLKNVLYQLCGSY